MKRAAAFLGILALLSSSIALAHECTVVNKPDGAGSGMTASVELTTGDFTFTGADLNAAGKPKGAFMTVTVTYLGQPVDTVDVFHRKTLPDGALNSGPGDSTCDGVGIDAASTCVP